MKQRRTDPLVSLEEELNRLAKVGLLREPATPESPSISVTSNDYLGLAARPAPAVAAGAGASRLVSGEHAEHRNLERAFAEWLGFEDGLAFTSGYAANLGTVAALAGPGDLIVSDALNHASLIDGARLSRARVAVTPHGDVEAIADRLRRRTEARAVVAVESYYGMDADGPDLRALREVCTEEGAFLLVDEAHALGVLGPDGRGRCSEAGVVPDALVVTLGKAFGAQGAVVLGARTLRRYLWNKARSFVFSTGLAPAEAAAATAALRVLREDPRLPRLVAARAAQMRTGLVHACGLVGEGAPVVAGFGPVVPVVVGSTERAVRLSGLLREEGFVVPPIRPPTVPEGTARLRVTVTAKMDPAEVDRFLQAAKRAFDRLGDDRASSTASARRAARLVVVGGTGTEIGKTFVARAICHALRAASPDAQIAAVKPVESGRTEADPASDVAQLEHLSTFHVKRFPPPYLLARPVSPHLAARAMDRAIDLPTILDWLAPIRTEADLVILELAGGLFSPLAPRLTNADLVAALRPDALLLVAPDRLGVLHDVGAATRAAQAEGLRIRGIVLSATATPDASTGTNAAELCMVTRVPVLATLPRTTVDDPRVLDALTPVVREFLPPAAVRPS